MAIHYNWTVSKADARTTPLNGLEKVILNCEWLVSATEGDTTLSSYGKVEFPEPSPTDFIDVTEVKQSTILEWVFDVIEKDAIEEELAARLRQHRQPETISISIPKG
jgi:hypothetical protein